MYFLLCQNIFPVQAASGLRTNLLPIYLLCVESVHFVFHAVEEVPFTFVVLSSLSLVQSSVSHLCCLKCSPSCLHLAIGCFTVYTSRSEPVSTTRKNQFELVTASFNKEVEPVKTGQSQFHQPVRTSLNWSWLVSSTWDNQFKLVTSSFNHQEDPV